MAEGIIQSQQNSSFHAIAKRKLEKIKNKLVEFFSYAKPQQQSAIVHDDGPETTKCPVNEPSEIAMLDDGNIFDRDYMTKYIEQFLIRKIKQSDMMNRYRLDLRMPAAHNDQNKKSTSLMYDIASRIYSQCESEPMGIKGCKLTINLALINKIELNMNDVIGVRRDCLEPGENYFLNNCRFDTTTTLTTFELVLNLREDPHVFCLRRILPRTKFFDRIRTMSAIYLDKTFDLINHKLY
jgi:hypothetical protein